MAYQSPIQITSTQIVRAKLFCDGYLSPRSTAASFIFHNRKMTLPVISIIGDSKYFYDSKFGIIVEGNSLFHQTVQDNYLEIPVKQDVIIVKVGSKSIKIINKQ